MGLFDRWMSKKGKAGKAGPKKAHPASAADEEKKRIFAAVPSGQDAPAAPPAKQERPATVAAPAAAPKKPATNQPAMAVKETSGTASQILFRPLVTEKSSRQPGHYTFEVARDATKVDVRHAVEAVYGIRPQDVTIVRLPGKAIRYGRTVGRTVARKKAVVTLPGGKTIDILQS
ncbi:MAG: 50S ribosomal protein L23 [Candidatus Kerfeldbacteria bacterium]|nr:50S ribosomal protein L23 [Candidatus Kerfeldbacteria bacterium]